MDTNSRSQVLAAIRILEREGPQLKRPLAGKIDGSQRIPSLKELRPGSAGRSEIRILFAFDPKRKAILLVAGDKQNRWKSWYKKAIPEAEVRYDWWLEEEYGE
ncbi:type II toxin-antitoxin system RelE/ParE family toxin [Alloscardovia macacae]|uniref:type II toxin-antitoxin system RelE/ParE family toxin n=1 Tax=Alloscardovia macacae TaxID=1160091 RepID=UPI001FCE5C78